MEALIQSFPRYKLQCVDIFRLLLFNFVRSLKKANLTEKQGRKVYGLREWSYGNGIARHAEVLALNCFRFSGCLLLLPPPRYNSNVRPVYIPGWPVCSFSDFACSMEGADKGADVLME